MADRRNGNWRDAASRITLRRFDRPEVEQLVWQSPLACTVDEIRLRRGRRVAVVLR